jgi:thioredoxin 2
VEVAEAAFEKHVSGDLPVLVDFWAPWCGPCKGMAPHFAAAARELEPRVRLAKVNTDVEQGLAARHDIQGIPTLALFRGGREVARQAGAMGLQDLLRWVRPQLGQATGRAGAQGA